MPNNCIFLRSETRLEIEILDLMPAIYSITPYEYQELVNHQRLSSLFNSVLYWLLLFSYFIYAKHCSRYIPIAIIIFIFNTLYWFSSSLSGHDLLSF